MSEPKYHIENRNGEVIAWSKYGVLWRVNGEWVGSFAEYKAYDNEGNIVASLKGDEVVSVEDKVLGIIKSIENGSIFQLVVNGNISSQRGYSKTMSVGVIALLGNEL